MNDFYIEYMVKERMREERENCRKRCLLNNYKKHDLRLDILESVRSSFKLLGFENARIVDICRDLGISKRTIHKCFKSLGEILDSLLVK